MHTQITQLKRENQDLKDLLFDLSGMVIGKDKKNFGLTEQEIVARVTAVVGGVRFNPLDFDMSCKNGEQ